MNLPVCSACGFAMRLHRGLYGRLWRCPSSPSCANELVIDDGESPPAAIIAQDMAKGAGCSAALLAEALSGHRDAAERLRSLLDDPYLGAPEIAALRNALGIAERLAAAAGSAVAAHKPLFTESGRS